MEHANSTKSLIIREIPRLRRYARSLCPNTEDADDLVQNCLERALGRLSYFRAGTNLRAWLMTIMHNVHVNALSASSREPSSPGPHPDPITASTPPAWPRTLAMRDVGTALGRLTPAHREALLLVAMEQYSYKEAARIAGISVGTLMSRLHRARRRLAELLSDHEHVDLRRVK